MSSGRLKRQSESSCVTPSQWQVLAGIAKAGARTEGQALLKTTPRLPPQGVY